MYFSTHDLLIHGKAAATGETRYTWSRPCTSMPTFTNELSQEVATQNQSRSGRNLKELSTEYHTR